MVIYLDLGFNSTKKKIFSLYFLMECLQLGLPNNLSSAPARLSNRSVGAGAEENTGVYSAHWRILLLFSWWGGMGNCLHINQVQYFGSGHCLTHCCGSGTPCVVPGGRSTRQDSVDLRAGPATWLCSAQHGTCPLEPSTGCATAGSREALGSALPPTATSIGLSGVLPSVSLSRLSKGVSLAHA